MKSIGAHVKIEDGRYLVGLAVVQNGRLTDELTYPAPADRDEAGQLSELYHWVADVVAQQEPDAFALRTAEYQALTAEASLARHAEGALLAGVSHAGVTPISQWTRQRLIVPLGATGQKAADVRNAVLDHLDRAPTRGPVTEAACAAVAAAAS